MRNVSKRAWNIRLETKITRCALTLDLVLHRTSYFQFRQALAANDTLFLDDSLLIRCKYDSDESARDMPS